MKYDNVLCEKKVYLIVVICDFSVKNYVYVFLRREKKIKVMF